MAAGVVRQPGPDCCAAGAPNRPLNRVLIGMIRLYQMTLSRLLGPRCRFWPSCSTYARLCLEQRPAGQALTKIAGRILRCHPLHPGGIDLP